jgi:hypothetical protein
VGRSQKNRSFFDGVKINSKKHGDNDNDNVNGRDDDDNGCDDDDDDDDYDIVKGCNKGRCFSDAVALRRAS